MSIDFTVYEDAHPLGSKGDISFKGDKLYSVSDDSMLKEYSLTSKGLKMESQIELPEEPHSVACNSLNQLAIGGKDKMVNVYSNVNLPKELTEVVLAFKMKSEVRKVVFQHNHYVLGFSNDSEMGLYNTQSK